MREKCTVVSVVSGGGLVRHKLSWNGFYIVEVGQLGEIVKKRLQGCEVF